MRGAFGRKLELNDIYYHVTSPEKVYLLEKDSKILAMASYNKKILSGIPSLIVEGIAVSPEMQGKKVFRKITKTVFGNENVICLRTQNPMMYRALENYCSYIYPCLEEMPKAIKAIQSDLANYLDCKIDGNGVINGYYGGLFYGKEPVHKSITPFFKEIGLELNKGDALVAIGVR